MASLENQHIIEIKEEELKKFDNSIEYTAPTYSALTESNDDTLDFELPNNVNLYCNLPASLIELDVARETIRRFKGNNISKRRICECFLLQNNELVNQASNYTPKASLSIYNDLHRFLVLNLNKRTELYDDISRFHLKITRQKDKQFTLSIDNNEKGLGFVYSENNNLILTIFESLSISPVLNESSIFYEFEDMIPYRQMINIIQEPWKNEDKRYDMRFFKEIFSTDKKLDLDLLRRLSYYIWDKWLNDCQDYIMAKNISIREQ